MGEEETKILLRFRSEIEDRINKLQNETNDLRILISIIDKIIIKHGFQQAGPGSPSQELEDRTVSIRSKDGVLLGTLIVENNQAIFEPSKEIQFSTSTPPFQPFLIERVLTNMKISDEQRVEKGEIEPEEILEFDTQLEGDFLKRLIIRNYGDDRRLREIKSSLRWTLEKMYEKISESVSSQT
ncbi:hypothetical protein KEJ47_05095 [Candidatus Bathyarchaeota archaeon]|nr:hypothetical protein [Candidatus Bathyarchaeota archaeon]